MMFEVPLRYPAGMAAFGLAGPAGLGAEVCSTDDNGDQFCYDDGSGSTPVSQTNPVGNCAAGAVDLATGLCTSTAPSSTPTTTPATTPPAGTPASGAMTGAQLAALISGTGAAASQVIRASGSPYVIPGTNVLYNPATGQIVGSSSAVTASVLGTNLMPLLIVGVAAFMLISMSKH